MSDPVGRVPHSASPCPGGSIAPVKRGSARPRLGMRVIVAYKAIKAGVEIAGALLVALTAATNIAPGVLGLARLLHEHVCSEWSRQLSGILIAAADPRHLRLAALALGLDGVLTAFEGAALGRGWRWGPWLVVATTTSLLPVELFGLFEHGLNWGRGALIAANLAVVGYLIAHARRAVTAGRQRV